MEFSWTDIQETLYRQTLEFSLQRLGRRADGAGGEDEFAREQWRLCGQMGLLGMSVPERYGGGGLDSLTTARVMEAFGRGCTDMGLVFAVGAHLNACAMPIAEHGCAEIAAAFLPGLCSGALVGANAISEPEAGSDVAAIRTRAEVDGGDYMLWGEKSYVTNGPVADVFLVYAKTSPVHGHLGVTAFVVERDRPGLEVGPVFRKMGLHSAQMGPIRLEGCRVPVSRRLGKEGQGLAIFHRSMGWERTCLFGGYLGAMERQLERAIAYARERKQFRRPIGRFQAVSHRIADMKLQLDAARLLLYRACWMRDRGDEAALETSLAKLAISEAAIRVSLDTIRVHGGAGYIEETGVPQGLQDAIPSVLFSGTSDLQRNIIAAKLGL